jgi:hypothetical protein
MREERRSHIIGLVFPADQLPSIRPWAELPEDLADDLKHTVLWPITEICASGVRPDLKCLPLD